MALVPLLLPKVGLVMENARLVRWLKRVGDEVRQGEALLELETEKSVVEIEATESGRLTELLLHENDEARVGDQIAWLETGASAAGATAGAAAPSPAAAATRRAVAATATPGTPAAEHGASGQPPGAGRGRIRSSPVARRLAAEHAVDLRGVAGTGPRGRIQLADVRVAIAARLAGGSPAPLSGGPAPLSPMRRALARAMALSNATVPQFAVERAVDWTVIQTLRARLLADLPADAPRPSVTDFLLQAIARALLTYPDLNATFSGDVDSPDAAILPASGAHVGLVVAVGNGILVPVLHNVERCSIRELAVRREDVVSRALNGKLRREELEGATFSLSNLGADGPDRFNAVINPPQSAILAVGRQRDTVVAIHGGIHVRPTSQLTLTVDHRVADGRLASAFLAALADILEGDTWRLS
ncbi:MAG: dihydrolipoamide acetyltransferase family protein [Acidobacteriota bacterium]